jgi:hypothetical protein
MGSCGASEGNRQIAQFIMKEWNEELKKKCLGFR